MELSAGLTFSYCPIEGTSWQELKFQQVNPVRKRLVRMFWFPAPGSPGLRSQKQVLPRVSVRRSCGAVCSPVCPPANLNSTLVTAETGSVGRFTVAM